MRSIRYIVGKKLNQLMGGTGGGLTEAASGPSNYSRASIFWVASVAFVTLLTVILLGVCGNTVGVQSLLAILWGFLIGVGCLFYLNKKLIITIFGPAVGASIAEIKSLVDAVKSFTSISQSIAQLLNGTIDPPPHIYNWSIVLFILFILICCLPAYSTLES
jgi:hypothetical protein